jgi:two-component system invasion response regulator UvrY
MVNSLYKFPRSHTAKIPKNMIKIAIADDHPIVREGLKQIIARTSDLNVVMEASDGQEVLEKLRKIPVDLLLLDISMPVRNGVEILKQVRSKYPKLQILILSAHPETKYAVRVFRLGASGYLTKEGAPKELIGAIRTVLSGKRYISAAFAQQLVVNLDGDIEKPLHEKLSDRELEVLCQIAAGKPLTDIANGLFLSVKTISTYRTRILEKLHMRSNADLIRYAIQKELIEA